jgi:hypothetical protein
MSVNVYNEGSAGSGRVFWPFVTEIIWCIIAQVHNYLVNVSYVAIFPWNLIITQLFDNRHPQRLQHGQVISTCITIYGLLSHISQCMDYYHMYHDVWVIITCITICGLLLYVLLYLDL